MEFMQIVQWSMKKMYITWQTVNKKTNSMEQIFFNFMMFKENRVRISVKT